MKKDYSKLVIPTIYVAVITIMVVSTVMILNGINNFLNEETDYKYTLDGVFEGEVLPVVAENKSIVRPYVSTTVTIGKYFYDFESDSKEQESSLVYYQDTYMQNSGVDYIDKESFDVVSVLDGEIISIEENEIFGNIVTIKHTDNLTTVYSNIDNVTVKVGDQVSQGEIFASSGSSNLEKDFTNTLHFEVYHKGDVMDPENLYTLSIEDFR